MVMYRRLREGKGSSPNLVLEVIPGKEEFSPDGYNRVMSADALAFN